MRRRDNAKREQWRERIRQWRASGKSAEAFGREHGVSAAAVYWWSRTFKKQLATRTMSPPMPSVTFMPLAVRAATMERESIEVVVRGGRRVRVPERFSVSTLQEVVRAIEALH